MLDLFNAPIIASYLFVQQLPHRIFTRLIYFIISYSLSLIFTREFLYLVVCPHELLGKLPYLSSEEYRRVMSTAQWVRRWWYTKGWERDICVVGGTLEGRGSRSKRQVPLVAWWKVGPGGRVSAETYSSTLWLPHKPSWLWSREEGTLGREPSIGFHQRE